MAQISIITYKDTLEAKRIDAEYFKPEYLKDDKSLEKKGFYILTEISQVKGGKRLPLGKTFSESGVPYIRAEDIKNNFVKYENVPRISFDLHEQLKRYQTKKGDVLLTIVGNSVGDIGLVNFELSKCNLTENAAKITSLKKIIPEVMFSYLLSKYGQNQIHREKVGTAQPKLSLERIRKFRIPKLNQSFQQQIEEIVKEAHLKQTQSKQLYKEAEQLLLEELGLVNYQPKQQLFFETTKKEIDEAKRFDAEYFQPKYKEIIERIENYEGGFDVVKNQFNQNKTLSKKDKEFYNYIEISDVNVSNGEITVNKIDIKDVPANGKRKLFKNDLLISKVRPYRGAISFIDFEKENLLGSGAFTVLQEKTGYKKEVLMIFLKTKFIKELLLRYNCGTSYPVIKDEDILNLKIPLIKPQIQIKIAEKIKESHKLRKESKELLEEAKRMVEEEIEKQ